MPVAQLDRAMASDAMCRAFESHRAYHVGTSYACSDFFMKKNLPQAPLFLLFAKRHAVATTFLRICAFGAFWRDQSYDSFLVMTSVSELAIGLNRIGHTTSEQVTLVPIFLWKKIFRKLRCSSFSQKGTLSLPPFCGFAPSALFGGINRTIFSLS